MSFRPPLAERLTSTVGCGSTVEEPRKQFAAFLLSFVCLRWDEIEVASDARGVQRATPDVRS